MLDTLSAACDRAGNVNPKLKMQIYHLIMQSARSCNLRNAASQSFVIKRIFLQTTMGQRFNMRKNWRLLTLTTLSLLELSDGATTRTTDPYRNVQSRNTFLYNQIFFSSAFATEMLHALENKFLLPEWICVQLDVSTDLIHAH